MKDRDAGYEYINGIIMDSDIQIGSSCEANDSFRNAAYLTTTSVDDWGRLHQLHSTSTNFIAEK